MCYSGNDGTDNYLFRCFRRCNAGGYTGQGYDILISAYIEFA